LQLPLNFAVIGCGAIGARHLAVLAAEPGARIAAVCDTDTSRGRHFSDMYGGVPYFTNYEELLRTSDAAICNICTPHTLHAPIAIAAARAGKHVLVEKPMALSSRDAERMIAAAERHHVRLMVVKQNRYNAAVQATRDAVRSGALGPILMVQCNVLWHRPERYYSESPWRGRRDLDGGALWTQVSHFIDLMIWWCGDVVDAASVLATKKHDIEIEDCGTAQLRFAGGALGTIFWTTCAPSRNVEGSITIVGRDGLIKIGGAYLNSIEHWDVRGMPTPTFAESTDAPNVYATYQGTSSNHHRVIADVVRDVVSGNRAVVDGREGLRTVRAIERIYGNADWCWDDDPRSIDFERRDLAGNLRARAVRDYRTAI
jgi:UDP-N-acetyl-2-amino-2-deoxyglucuronate dehydrogenase